MDIEKDAKRVVMVTNYLQRSINTGKIHVDPESKVLLITESINSGRSLLPVLKSCKQLGINCEVITIGLQEGREVDDLEQEFGTKVYVGMKGTPGIYRSGASGVVKEQPSEYYDDARNTFVRQVPDVSIFAKPSKAQKAIPDQLEAQIEIDEVRREAKVLSNEIVDWFKAPMAAT